MYSIGTSTLHSLNTRAFIELQIEALAQENHIRSKRVQKFIAELRARLLAVKEINYEKLLKNKTFRLPLTGRPNSLSSDFPEDFKFIPPNNLYVLGGLCSLTSIKRAQFVDIAIEIPSDCLTKKDVKNQRYQQKRALYLTQLAHLLNGSTGLGIVDKLEFRFFNGDLYKPVLLITPKSTRLKDIIFQVFVIADFEECGIKLDSLSPERGHIAPKWFFQDYNFKTLDEDDELRLFVAGNSDACASPFYNSSMLVDAELTSNSEIISEHIGSKTSISEALIITKIWLFQRDLHNQFSFILSLFVSYLQTRQQIHQNMSSYQIFKILIRALVDTDWSRNGLSYFDDNKEKLPKFKAHFPVVLLSPSGRLNVCYNITIDTYYRLRHEAAIANNLLNSTSPDVFDILFLRKVNFNDKFDLIVHLPKCLKKLPDSLKIAKQLMDYGVLTPRVHSQNIMNLLSESLTDRIELAQQNPHHLLLNKKWPFRSVPYDPTNEDQTFSFGVLLNAEKSLRIIDIGPEAQTPEASKFREFWDPKSQLRLQNGVISETVVWHVDSFSQRRTIVKYILDHILRKAHINTFAAHYNQIEKFIELTNVRFAWRDDVNHQENRNAKENGEEQAAHHRQSIKRKKNDQQVGRCIGVGDDIYLKILNSYNQLNKLLRNVEGLKHSITSIQPVSHHLRASGVFPPLPVSLQHRNKSLKRHKGVTMFPNKFDEVGKILFIEPIDILVTLDSTSKWSHDFGLLEAEKLDYLINLGEKLRTREYTIKFAEDFLDILYGQFVFRLRFRCHKELSLVAQARGEIEFLKRRLDHEIMPRIHGALDQCYKEKPAFCLTCRLVKRWISCHLMTECLNDITIDLIVAHLFLHPQPYTEPGSSACGFKRFLQLVAEHDWNEAPLIVNFDNHLKIDEIRRLRTIIREERNKYPPMVICTPFDEEFRSPWTQQDPSESKLEMLRKICSKGSEFFVSKILASETINLDECRSLFRPNFKLFNLIIKLHNNIVQTYFMSIDPPKNFLLTGKDSQSGGPSALKVMPIVDFNAVERFVNLLRVKFADIAWFFFDKYGQRIIGVVMKPESEKVLEGDINKFMHNIKVLDSKIVSDVSLVKRND